MDLCKGGGVMISYTPLWKTMKSKGVTTYTLRYKGLIGGGTIQRLKKNETISTHTLDMLCKILDCRLSDVIEYIPDEEAAEQSRGSK